MEEVVESKTSTVHISELTTIPDKERDEKSGAEVGVNASGWFGWWQWASASSPALVTLGDGGDDQKESTEVKAGEVDNEDKDQVKSPAGESRQLSEAEQIKEAALARDSPPLSNEAEVAGQDATPLTASPDDAAIEGEQAKPISTTKPPQTLDASSQNSILLSTSAAGSSWAKFFTGNATLKNWNQKRIEGGSVKDTIERKTGDAEEEVMTIDFGEAGAEAGGGREVVTDTKSVTSVKGTSKAKAGSIKSIKSVVNSPVPPSPTDPKPKERSRPSTPEPPKDKPQPPITESKKVKKDVSVTPAGSSNVSRSSSPTRTSAKRPSLILPTFEDTFYSPPRSVLPMHLKSNKDKGKGKAVELFKSGVSAISGYLLCVDIDLEELEKRQTALRVQARRARVMSPVTSPGYTWSKAVNEKLDDLEEGIWWDKNGEEIGTRLPRHLRVLRRAFNAQKKESWVKGNSKETQIEDLDKEYLKGCKNIVVIGIHGWFPGTLVRSVIGAVR
jgi:hypothetical protein